MKIALLIFVKKQSLNEILQKFGKFSFKEIFVFANYFCENTKPNYFSISTVASRNIAKRKILINKKIPSRHEN
jgi:hypothetical protein